MLGNSSVKIRSSEINWFIFFIFFFFFKVLANSLLVMCVYNIQYLHVNRNKAEFGSHICLCLLYRVKGFNGVFGELSVVQSENIFSFNRQYMIGQPKGNCCSILVCFEEVTFDHCMLLCPNLNVKQ